MKRLFLGLAAAALIVVPGMFLAAPASASAPEAHYHVAAGLDDYEYESLASEYFLSRDAHGHATVSVVETWVVLFPTFDQNRGIVRAIPNDYDGVPLHTVVESVVDENGVMVPFDDSMFDGFTEVALGNDNFVHGRTTYVITYTQENVVRAFDDTASDEFYWDVNGTGNNLAFGSVSARVHIDPELTEFLSGNTACYWGSYGADNACDIVQESGEEGETFTSSVSNLGAHENLTVVVGFDYGTFVQVPPEFSPGGDVFRPGAPPWWFDAGGMAIVILTVLGTTFAIVWRFVTPASSKGSGIIIPQYTVPKGINLLESADIIGRRSSGVSAQIVSFAVRGKLRILDYPVTQKGKHFTLQLLDTTGVDDHELALLTALFGTGIDSTVWSALRTTGLFGDEGLRQIQAQANTLVIGAVREVGVIDDKAARAVAAVAAAVPERVITRGFKLKRSPLAGILIALTTFIFGIVAFVITIAGSFSFSLSAWGLLAVVTTVFGTLFSASFAWRPAVLTASGAELNDYLLGMRDYLKLAEADRFRMLQSPEGAQRVRAEGLDVRYPGQKVKLYEKLLPFAIAWGIEREWSQELAIYYGDAAPEWFVSTRPFNVVSFANTLTTISRATVVSSTPSTSSSWSGSSMGSFSGGSRGGGFSGGGGGGGGSRGR